MKWETIKSIILIFLIGVSLVLSFVLWNFQPKYGTLQSKYVSEVDLGGIETTKRALVRPKAIIFHKDNNFYRFHNINDETEYFEAMFDWDFSDITFEAPKRWDLFNEMVEIQFPLPIQASLLHNIYTVEKPEQLPNWSFQKILIKPNKQLLTLEVYFVSPNGEQSFRMSVNNSEIYMDVTAPFSREHHLAKQIQLQTGNDSFYLPEKSVNLPRRSLAIEYIEPSLLVNALFRNPSLVSHTIGETNYNDGQRMMEVLNDGRSMEFTNPIEISEHLSFSDMLNTTIEHINEHKGWTNNFILDELDTHTNRIQFKMSYGGYPVISHEDYSMIEQRWAGQDLYQYKRPLFKLTNLLNSEEVSLPSGLEIVEYLSENENYNLDQINDIRLAYRLIYEEGSFSVRLEPTWYLKYNERWTELILEPIKVLDKEGV